jgi:hypothetical protein
MVVDTADGVVLVEVSDSAVGGYEQVSVGDELLLKSRQTLDQAMQTMRNVADSVSSVATQAVRPPTSVEVAFGLKFGASSGVIVAKGNAEVNLQVKMTWSSTSGAS